MENTNKTPAFEGLDLERAKLCLDFVLEKGGYPPLEECPTSLFEMRGKEVEAMENEAVLLMDPGVLEAAKERIGHDRNN